MGGRKDLLNARIGTSFDVKHWLALDPCGILGLLLSASVHLFAFATVCTNLIEGSFFATAVFLLGYTPVTLLALASLYMAWTTDPGAVPMGARPLVTVKRASSGEISPAAPKRDRALSRCHKCNDNYKPPRAHHDSVTGRCIVKFDHFCPWVGNAVGALNHKFFVLFIFYTVLSCLLSLFLFLIRAIHCAYMIDDSSGDEVGATYAPDTDSATSATTSTTLDDNQANLEDEQLNFFLRGRFLSSSHTNYAREECHGWYEHTSVLILFFVSLVFLIFTCCMLAEQIEAIETNASKIARMKMRVGQAGTELSRVTEEFNEMFGGKDKNVAWHWFLPLSVDFLRGMKKVVLGYEWDETFDPVPYDEDARATAAAAAAAAGGVDEEQGQGKIELTTTPRTGSGVPTSGGGASATSTASTATSMLKSPPPNSGLDTPSAVAAAAAAASASAGNDGSQAQPFTKKSPASAETLTKRVNSRASSKERLDVSNGTLT